jgi:hypothetical protein
MLGPRSALDEAGFDVEPGDTLRVRVFTGDDGDPLAAQRVLNLTRRTMMRLRTLHRDPLWNTSGRWEGGSPFRGGDAASGRGRGARERGGGNRLH